MKYGCFDYVLGFSWLGSILGGFIVGVLMLVFATHDVSAQAWGLLIFLGWACLILWATSTIFIVFGHREIW